MRSLADQLGAVRPVMASNADQFASAGNPWKDAPDTRRHRATPEQLARESARLAVEQQKLEHKERRAIAARTMTLREHQLNTRDSIERQLAALRVAEQPEDALHFVTESDIARRVAAPPASDIARRMASALDHRNPIDVAIEKALDATARREATEHARKYADAMPGAFAPF